MLQNFEEYVFQTHDKKFTSTPGMDSDKNNKNNNNNNVKTTTNSLITTKVPSNDVKWLTLNNLPAVGHKNYLEEPQKQQEASLDYEVGGNVLLILRKKILCFVVFHFYLRKP